MGEEQRGCGTVGEEVFLWWGGQRRGMGYHVSCKEGEAGLLCRPLLTLTTGPEQVVLRKRTAQVLHESACF